MNEPLRVIKFGQTHRRTGARRRFIIAQFDDRTATLGSPADGDTERHARGGTLAWRYKVQLGDNGVWSAFRPIEVAADATEEVIRRAAVRHLSGRSKQSGGSAAA